MYTSATQPIAKTAANSVDRRLEKTCQDFEAVFLSMIWKEMQKSAGTDLGGWDAFAEQALGQHWAKGGGIGLAKVIYKAMAKHL
ncbi:MAG: hypothetical protein ACM3WU_07425 [Bacillota bacterium]